MRDTLFHLNRKPNVSIQSQIREMLVSAILGGQLPPSEPLPSCRKMAKTLKVSRNTVVLAYQGLADDGYLKSRERSGFYVDSEILEGHALPPGGGAAKAAAPAAKRLDASKHAPDWQALFRTRASGLQHNRKPPDWMSYPYPFIYGQVDPTLFPIAAWRECTRQALGTKGMADWTADTLGADDPLLIEQIRTRLLPRRGILAEADQILITLGAQNAISLLADLLVDADTTVAIEDPGYPDMRNIFSLKTDHLKAIAVDEDGLPVDQRLDDCNLVYVTPSHQHPTTATMPLERRLALLERAAEKNFLIIEDDYEPEANYLGEPTPALKSLDDNDRVLYIGSLSKSLFPGLRIGYLVGPRELIAEAQALRQLMMRHPPTNNQRTTALFLSLGHHDTMVHRLHRAYRARWEMMGQALSKYLPDSARNPTFGGTSYWVKGPNGLNAAKLAQEAIGEGVVIEPGRINFMARNAPKNYFRLGFSSLPLEKIEPGIKLLAGLIGRQASGSAK